MATALTVFIVTDPLCSWCWGMADAIDAARSMFRADVEFDLVLGGINTDSTQPVGAYGRRRMKKLWRDVAETTGQVFAELPVESYVHNSLPLCLTLERIRMATGQPPFELLRAMQVKFFTAGFNVTDPVYLRGVLAETGIEMDDIARLQLDAALMERVKFQFDMARRFGTQALPSVLTRRGSDTRLLAGGYVDAAMLETLIRGALDH